MNTLIAKIRQIFSLRADRRLDYFDFAYSWLSTYNAAGKKNYCSALRSLERFCGKRQLPFSEINYEFLSNYERWMDGKARAQSLYLAAIKHIYMEALKVYDNDQRQRLNNPFNLYKPPRQKLKGQRALLMEELVNIYKFKPEKGTKMELARDCFVFSFLTMGTNSVDLYGADIHIKNGFLCYRRQKTRSRRADEAYIEVKLHPAAMGFVSKYKDTERLFCFHRKFPNEGQFNKALNVGLHQMEEACGVKNLQFYKARHTMASIARNECRIEKYLVNEMLNHVDSDMRLTDLYIKKDFGPINDANMRMIDFVLSKLDAF